MGSASELESEALVAEGLGFLTTAEAADLLPRISLLRRQLTAFHQSLEKRRPREQEPARAAPEDPPRTPAT